MDDILLKLKPLLVIFDKLAHTFEYEVCQLCEDCFSSFNPLYVQTKPPIILCASSRSSRFNPYNFSKKKSVLYTHQTSDW